MHDCFSPPPRLWPPVFSQTLTCARRPRQVERQRQVLLDVLQEDGRYAPEDPASVSTLQYNSPFTLPWRRRNEVALVVTRRDADSADPPEVRGVLARQSEPAAATRACAREVVFVVWEVPRWIY